jgi:hypothetical protein
MQRGVPAVARDVRSVPERRGVSRGRGRAGGQRVDGVPAVPELLVREHVRDRGVPAVERPGVHGLHGRVRRGPADRAGLQRDGGHGVRPVCDAMRGGAVPLDAGDVLGDEQGGRGAGELRPVPSRGRLHARGLVSAEQLHGRGDADQRVSRVRAAAVPGRVLQRGLRRVQGHDMPAAPELLDGEVSAGGQRDRGGGVRAVPELCSGGPGAGGGVRPGQGRAVRGPGVQLHRGVPRWRRRGLLRRPDGGWRQRQGPVRRVPGTRDF